MQLTRPIAFPANPGASSAAVVFDNGPKDSAGTAGPYTSRALDKAAHMMQRVSVSFYTNVADALFRVEWEGWDSTNLRKVITDVAIAANTYFNRDVRVPPGRLKVSIVTVTNPGTWEGAAELIPDSALAQ